LPADGPDRPEEGAADPWADGPAAERGKAGLYRRLQRSSVKGGAGPLGLVKSENPHLAYNKTIPFRFILVNRGS
jgi:hypothetical protein